MLFANIYFIGKILYNILIGISENFYDKFENLLKKLVTKLPCLSCIIKIKNVPR